MLNHSIINYPNPFVRNFDHQCPRIAKSIFGGPFVDRWFVSNSQICPPNFGPGSAEPNSVRFEDINGTTYANATDALRSHIPLLNVQVKLERNIERDHTIAVIIIPILSIFYLLGATFMFEQTKGDPNAPDDATVGNRLLLTLGVFALIFTLPEILDQMKPETSASTVGDSLLSIIVVANYRFHSKFNHHQCNSYNKKMVSFAVHMDRRNYVYNYINCCNLVAMELQFVCHSMACNLS